MRNFIVFAAVAACLSCGGGGGTTPETQTKTSSTSGAVVLCSSSMGPLAGPLTGVDAGDVQGCQTGGQCMYVSSPPPGGQAGPCTEILDDSGNGGMVNCPQTTFVPGWECVYSTGVAGPGGNGGH